MRGPGTRAYYVRLLLTVNTLDLSKEAREIIGSLGARKIFDSEYKFRKALVTESSNTSMLTDILENLYMSQAYDAWYFFAYPSRLRMNEHNVSKLIEAGLVFRAQWLILDHLEVLEEDRRIGTITGVRLVLDTINGINGIEIIETLVERFHKRFARIIKELSRRTHYAENLVKEYNALKRCQEKKLSLL